MIVIILSLLSLMIFGIILVTIDYSKKSVVCPVIQEEKINYDTNLENIYNDMFNTPSPWVGTFRTNEIKKGG